MSENKPLLKWVGGKTQILEDVLNSFPTSFNNYIEPFIGGGSVFLGLLEKIELKEIECKGKIISCDINSNLINFYKSVQSEPENLLKELNKLKKEFKQCKSEEDINRNAKTLEEALSNPESYYYYTRWRFNTLETSSVYKAALFLFLNKTCFRGIYREGPNGFNVPYGNYKNPSFVEDEHLYKISKLIKDVEFCNISFEESIKKAKKEDFVYMDPPYAPEKSTSFVKYSAEGFDLEKHKSLFTMCKDMKLKKIKWVMSNSYTELIKDEFKNDEYNIEIIECKRSINSKKPNSKTNEVIISSF